MATDHTDSTTLAQLRAKIETYLQQPDGDTLTADRAAALLRTVGRCIAERAFAIEGEEHDVAAATTWAAGRHTEEYGKDLIGGDLSWRRAFVYPDQRLMDAWAKEKGRNPHDLSWPELDEAALAAMMARYDDQY